MSQMTPEQFIQRFDFYADLDHTGQSEFFFQGCRNLLSEVRGWGITYKAEDINYFLTHSLRNLRQTLDKVPDLEDFRNELMNILALI